MSKIEIEDSAFALYARNVKEQISLLDNFQLPQAQCWEIDWKQLENIQKPEEQVNWSQLPIYKELLANNNYPAIYYFTTEITYSRQLFALFQKSKQESSSIRIEKGLELRGSIT